MIVNQIAVLTIRENRMIERIDTLRNGTALVVMGVKTRTLKRGPRDVSQGEAKRDAERARRIPYISPDVELGNEEETTKEAMAADARIIELEEALTRIQTTKAKLLADLARIDTANQTLWLNKAKAVMEYQKLMAGQGGVNKWGDSVTDMFAAEEPDEIYTGDAADDD